MEGLTGLPGGAPPSRGPSQKEPRHLLLVLGDDVTGNFGVGGGRHDVLRLELSFRLVGTPRDDLVGVSVADSGHVHELLLGCRIQIDELCLRRWLGGGFFLGGCFSRLCRFGLRCGRLPERETACHD